MMKNLIKTLLKKITILLVIVFSLIVSIDYIFNKNQNYNTVKDVVTIKNIIENNDVINIFLTKSFNQSTFFQKLKIIKKDNNTFTFTINSKNFEDGQKNISKIRNEITNIQEQVKIGLKSFIKAYEPEPLVIETMPDTITAKELNEIKNNIIEQEIALLQNKLKKLNTLNPKNRNINIGYFMVTNNENFLFVDLERSYINSKSLIIYFFKYSYYLILSLIFSLFFLYFFNRTNKKSLMGLLKKFT